MTPTEVIARLRDLAAYDAWTQAVVSDGVMVRKQSDVPAVLTRAADLLAAAPELLSVLEEVVGGGAFVETWADHFGNCDVCHFSENRDQMCPNGREIDFNLFRDVLLRVLPPLRSARSLLARLRSEPTEDEEGEAPFVQPVVPTTASTTDWTQDDAGRSNSSPEFLRLVAAVARLIRNDAQVLLAGNAEMTARLIVAQLAHAHGLAPVVVKAVTGPTGQGKASPSVTVSADE